MQELADEFEESAAGAEECANCHICSTCANALNHATASTLPALGRTSSPATSQVMKPHAPIELFLQKYPVNINIFQPPLVWWPPTLFVGVYGSTVLHHPLLPPSKK